MSEQILDMVWGVRVTADLRRELEARAGKLCIRPGDLARLALAAATRPGWPELASGGSGQQAAGEVTNGGA
jgi:hypothetical protein